MHRKDNKGWTADGIKEMNAARANVNQMLKAKSDSKPAEEESVAGVDMGSEGDKSAENARSGGSNPLGASLKRRQTLGKKSEEKAKKNDPKLWYEFRGECYIHGMMDGEAIRERLYQEVPDRTFELR